MPNKLIKIHCRNNNGNGQSVYLPAWAGENITGRQQFGEIHLSQIRWVLLPQLRRWWLYPRGGNATRLRIDFLWHLNLLLRSGVSLTEALKQLYQAGNSPLVNGCIIGLLIDLHQGKNLASALERARWLFPARVLATMHHAEKAGQISEILDKIIDNDEWTLVCTRKILRALLYPAILLAIMVFIALVMLFVIAPNFAQLLIDSGKMDPQQPPLWWLMSQWASQQTVWMSALVGTLAMLWLIWGQRHRLIRLLSATELLHFSRQLHLFEFLYEAGIHLPEVILALAESETSSRERLKYLRIAELLRQGRSLDEAFKQVPVLPPLVLTLLRAGESCGRLGYAARQAGISLERDANNSMKNFEQWLTPICLLAMGGLMAWLFTSLTSVLYDFN